MPEINEKEQTNDSKDIKDIGKERKKKRKSKAKKEISIELYFYDNNYKSLIIF